MSYDAIAAQGLVLLGCGKMGGAMLAGWLRGGLPPASVHVIDPSPSDWLLAQGVRINAALPADPAVALVAVKPQMMADALPRLKAALGPQTLLISVAAGTPIAAFEAAFGQVPIVRAMPNTPAAIGRGITAIIGNAQAGAAHLAMARGLLAAVGQVVDLQTEADIDAVTGLSGSGPAYVFHMIDCVAAAGVAEGLAPDLAMALAKATVAGAGALAEAASETPTQLRINVTSPQGTTDAGLRHLMDPETGLAPLMARTIAAATARGKELSRD